MLVIVGLAFLAIAISVWAHLIPVWPLDLRLTLLWQSADGQPLRRVMEAASFILSGWRATLIVTLSAVLVWWRLGVKEGMMVVAAGLVSLINSAIKLAVGRPRPAAEVVRVLDARNGNGFPSGHACLAVLVLGMLAYLMARNVRRGALRTVSLAGLLALILLVGVSRVYLGAHWPSDVAGGYIWGGLFLVIIIYAAEMWQDGVSILAARRLKKGPT